MHQHLQERADGRRLAVLHARRHMREDRADVTERHGRLCVRSRFSYQVIDSKERLCMTLVRTKEGCAPRSKFEVMDTVVGRLKAIKTQHGPNTSAGLITTRCT